MAIKLPDRNYFTFPELRKRWECEEEDFFHLLVDQKLVPSYFFDDVIDVAYVDEYRRHYDGQDPFDLVHIPPMKFIADGIFMYLLDPVQTSAGNFRYNVMASTRSGDPLNLKTPVYPPMIFLDRTISFEDLMTKGAVMMSEVALFEDSASHAENGVIDPADLPEELSAANIAFRAVSNGYGDVNAPFKRRLIDYLEKHYLAKKLLASHEAVERIATVANPDKSPGRKRRGSK
jgi:hypothetical protein